MAYTCPLGMAAFLSVSRYLFSGTVFKTPLCNTAFRSITDHRTSSQISPVESQQCGQSATHDRMFSLSLAMVIAAMVIRNFELRNVNHMSHECMLNAHYFAEICLKIGPYRAEIFQNWERNYRHVGKCYFDASQGL